MTGKVNPLNGWISGIHTTASNKTAAQANIGSYATVAQNACLSYHAPRNAAGAARLLRGPNEQDCLACHSGGSNFVAQHTECFRGVRKNWSPVSRRHESPRRSHLVSHVCSSPLAQPSLLVNMLNLVGVTESRSMGT